MEYLLAFNSKQKNCWAFSFIRNISKLLAVAVAVLLLLIPLSMSQAAPVNVIVYQPTIGQPLKMLIPYKMSVITLAGTENMRNIVVGDVDGDGLEDDLVYTDASTGALCCYEIVAEGAWSSNRNRTIPNVPANMVPLTVLRTAAFGAGIIIYRNPLTFSAFAIRPDGSGLTSLGRMDRAYALDLKGRGYAGDLVWWSSNIGIRWRDGISGTDSRPPWSSYSVIPLGGGRIVPNLASRQIAAYSRYDASIYVIDQNWNATPISGTSWTWSTNPGAVIFGCVDGDGISEIIYSTTITDIMRVYNVPDNGGPWNASNTLSYSDIKCGQTLRGCARVDFAPAAGPVSVSKISDLANYSDGTVIQLAAKARTKLVREIVSGSIATTGYYIEESDRTAGIRVVGTSNAAEGQFVAVTGKLENRNGERVIVATNNTISSNTTVIAPISVDIPSLYGQTPLTGLLVKLEGFVSGTGTGWFTLYDGTSKSVKVYCPDYQNISGSVSVTGCVGAENDSNGKAVPVIRVESAAKDIYIKSVADSSNGSGTTPPPSSTAVDFSAWCVSSLDKVLKTDAEQTLSAMTIRAARHEHEAFQIVVRAKNKNVSGLSVITNDLINGNNKISASNVTVYQQYYVNLPRLGKAYPDPIPPITGPINIAANDTVPIWVDVYVPKDAAPGSYSSSIILKAADGQTINVPFNLYVYNFTLPDDWKLTTSAGLTYQWIADKHGVSLYSSEGIALAKKYYEFCLQKGLSPYYLPLPNSSWYTAEVEPYLKDKRMTSFCIPLILDNPAEQKRMFDRIKSLGAWDKGYCYIWDEPRTQTDYQYVFDRGSYVKKIDPTVHTVCPFNGNPIGTWTTMNVFQLLEPYVDTWCFVTTFYDAANIEAQRKQGDRIWDYICYGVFSPFANFYLDYACLEHRMIFWQNYNFDITGFLYWELAYWQQVSDPWTDQHTCKTFSYEVYGEGSLLYPGKKVGINGPVSSIRLEVIRDGLEDYQYLWLLEQKIGKSAAKQLCAKVLTSGSFTRDKNLFNSVRDEIARKIEQ